MVSIFQDQGNSGDKIIFFSFESNRSIALLKTTDGGDRGLPAGGRRPRATTTLFQIWGNGSIALLKTSGGGDRGILARGRRPRATTTLFQIWGNGSGKSSGLGKCDQDGDP